MSLQVIKSIDGEVEYVLLPIHAYETLKPEIEKVLKGDEYVPFLAEDYISNPVALARINARITQQELAEALNVSQAYISKLEAQDKVSAKALKNIKDGIMMLLKGREAT